RGLAQRHAARRPALRPQAIDRARLGPHHEPRLDGAAARIIGRGVLPDLPEHLLQHVLGGLPLADDAPDEPEGQPGIAIVEPLEGPGVARGEAGHELLAERLVAHLPAITTKLASPLTTIRHRSGETIIDLYDRSGSSGCGDAGGSAADEAAGLQLPARQR